MKKKNMKINTSCLFLKTENKKLQKLFYGVNELEQGQNQTKSVKMAEVFSIKYKFKSFE